MGGNAVCRLGYWSALLVTVWVALFGLSMFLGLFGIATLHFSFFVCLLLAPSFVVMMTSIHHQAPAEKKIWSHLGLSFAVIYAVFATIVYYVQLTAIRNSSGDALRPFVYDPGTVFFAVDMLGYGFMCLSTWFAAPVFVHGDRLSAWIRRLAILHGLLVFSTLLAPAFMSASAPSGGADDNAARLAMISWCLLFGTLSLLVARYFRHQGRQGSAEVRPEGILAGNNG